MKDVALRARPLKSFSLSGKRSLPKRNLVPFQKSYRTLGTLKDKELTKT